MTIARRSLLQGGAALLASPALPALAVTAIAVAPAFAGDPTIQADKKVITSADQMPRRKYKITKLPSELLEAPKADLKEAADALDKDLADAYRLALSYQHGSPHR